MEGRPIAVEHTGGGASDMEGGQGNRRTVSKSNIAQATQEERRSRGEGSGGKLMNISVDE